MTPPPPPPSLDALADLLAWLAALAPADRMRPQALAAGQDLLSPGALPPDAGAAAIVAVIDHAIPFAHHLLTTADGQSRVAAIWMQGAPVMAPCPDIPFGQELRGSEIDRLRGAGSGAVLAADELYRRLGILDPATPGRRWLMRERTHGAAITCTAAGFRPDDRRGLAHPLIAVGLPDWALADTSGAATPLLLMAGILFIVSRARLLAAQMSRREGRAVRLPLVVNISLGISAGPRDGTSPLERLVDAIAAAPPPGIGPVHFVFSGGNARQERLHARLNPGEAIGWQLLPDDRTPSELQLWSAPQPPGQPPIGLRLTLPCGRSMSTAFRPPVPGRSQIARLRDDAGRELARLSLQARAGGQGGIRQVLTLILPPSTSDHAAPALTAAGIWQVALLPGAPGACEVLVQRDDRIAGFPRAGRQSRLVDPLYRPRLPGGGWPGPDVLPAQALIRRNGTCNAYAWGRAPIRVGAAVGGAGFGLAAGGSPRPSFYDGLLACGSAGDILAAGDRGPALAGVRSPGVRGRVMQGVGGTSIAAPRVTRWLAGRLAAGAGLATRDQVLAAATAPTGQTPPRVDPDLPWDAP